MHVNKAARTVLMDWNTGKITFYTHPPEEYKPSTHVSAKIVSGLGKAFDVSALVADDDQATLACLTRDVTTTTSCYRRLGS